MVLSAVTICRILTAKRNLRIAVKHTNSCGGLQVVAIELFLSEIVKLMRAVIRE